MNQFARLAKRTATILLIASFFLPLTRCKSMAQEDVPISESVNKDQAPVIRYIDIYGYNTVALKDWPVWALTFFWPLVFQVARLIAPSKLNTTTLFVVEALLLGFSAFQISYLIYISDGVRYGSYIAYTGILTYALALIAEFREQRLVKGNQRGRIKGYGGH